MLHQSDICRVHAFGLQCMHAIHDSSDASTVLAFANAHHTKSERKVGHCPLTRHDSRGKHILHNIIHCIEKY